MSSYQRVTLFPLVGPQWGSTMFHSPGPWTLLSLKFSTPHTEVAAWGHLSSALWEWSGHMIIHPLLQAVREEEWAW